VRTVTASSRVFLLLLLIWLLLLLVENVEDERMNFWNLAGVFLSLSCSCCCFVTSAPNWGPIRLEP
jgi:hypothetical protein